MLQGRVDEAVEQLQIAVRLERRNAALHQNLAQALLRKGVGRELAALRRELGTHWMIRRALHHFQQKDYSQLVDLLDVSAREYRRNSVGLNVILKRERNSGPCFSGRAAAD